MALQPKGVWWSNEPIPQLIMSTVHPDVHDFFGISPAYDDSDPFTRWLSPYEHLDAKSAFRQISGEGEILPIPSLPAPVLGSPPESPSAFSDGSFTNPSLPHFGLASADVWWPGRDTPLSAPELVHSDHMVKQDGVAIMGYVGGYRSSSTRIELVGVILAITSNLPVLLACDSQSVVRRAIYYHNHMVNNNDQKWHSTSKHPASGLIQSKVATRCFSQFGIHRVIFVSL